MSRPINVAERPYFAIPDFQNFTADGSINASTSTFTSATVTFKSTDVGKRFYVPGAGISGGNIETTITSVVSTHQVNLATNASTTVSANAWAYGTDNRPAFQQAITDAAALNVDVYIPGSANPYHVYSSSTTNLNIPSNIRIYGDGWNHTTIQTNPYWTTATLGQYVWKLFTNTTGANPTWAEFTVSGPLNTPADGGNTSDGTGASYGFYISQCASNQTGIAKIRNVRFTNQIAFPIYCPNAANAGADFTIDIDGLDSYQYEECISYFSSGVLGSSGYAVCRLHVTNFVIRRGGIPDTDPTAPTGHGVYVNPDVACKFINGRFIQGPNSHLCVQHYSSSGRPIAPQYVMYDNVNFEQATDYAVLPPTVITEPSWQSSHTYTAGALVVNHSRLYVCSVGGVSAASGGPTSTAYGTVVTDNTVTWKDLGIWEPAHTKFTNCKFQGNPHGTLLQDKVTFVNCEFDAQGNYNSGQECFNDGGSFNAIQCDLIGCRFRGYATCYAAGAVAGTCYRFIGCEFDTRDSVGGTIYVRQSTCRAEVIDCRFIGTPPTGSKSPAVIITNGSLLFRNSYVEGAYGNGASAPHWGVIAANAAAGTIPEIRIENNNFNLTSGVVLYSLNTYADAIFGNENIFSSSTSMYVDNDGGGTKTSTMLLKRGLYSTSLNTSATLNLSPISFDTFRLIGAGTVSNIYLANSIFNQNAFSGTTVRLIADGNWSLTSSGNVYPKNGLIKPTNDIVTLLYDGSQNLWIEV